MDLGPDELVASVTMVVLIAAPVGRRAAAEAAVPGCEEDAVLVPAAADVVILLVTVGARETDLGAGNSRVERMVAGGGPTRFLVTAGTVFAPSLLSGVTSFDKLSIGRNGSSLSESAVRKA